MLVLLDWRRAVFLPVVHSRMNKKAKNRPHPSHSRVSLERFNSPSLFSFQLTKCLSHYILSRKEKFFDDRNIKVALCEGDPLGNAFGVRAFHRTQVT